MISKQRQRRVFVIFFLGISRWYVGLDGVGPYGEALVIGKPSNAFDDFVHIAALAKKLSFGRDISFPGIIFMAASRAANILLREFPAPLPDSLTLGTKEHGQ